ncbi:hypothetical protein [Cupriavidus necator]|uniref:hypothetical protein n=1 Tax=Cupriavidus necator TaxID=106590 RepID=UPI0012D3134C|nr:hypothetical protein [Cupriavidus necator]
MAVPDWISYVGLAGGIIGTATGCMAYWRTGQLKALDLRLELSRQDIEVRHLVLGLNDLLAQARRSREAVAAATGRVGSGWLQGWMTQLQADENEVFGLLGALPPENASYRTAPHSDLESALSARHATRVKADSLRNKYVASLAEDDRLRSEIRAAHVPPDNR